MSKALQLITLFLSFAFAVIGGSVGLNALIKSNQEKSHLRASVPQGTRLIIDTSDIFNSGVVVTVVCALMAIVSLLGLGLALISKGLGAKKVLGGLLAFLAVWLLATQIAFTVFFATGSAGVRAFVGIVELPQSIIQQVEQSLGTTSVYKHIGYLRLVAIIPWFTILFGAIAAGVLLASHSSSTPTPAAAPRSPTSTATTTEKPHLAETA